MCRRPNSAPTHTLETGPDPYGGRQANRGRGRQRTSVEETLGLFYGNTDTTDTNATNLHLSRKAPKMQRFLNQILFGIFQPIGVSDVCKKR